MYIIDEKYSIQWYDTIHVSYFRGNVDQLCIHVHMDISARLKLCTGTFTFISSIFEQKENRDGNMSWGEKGS